MSSDAMQFECLDVLRCYAGKRLKHSTPRLPEVVDFPRCNNADIDWYVSMPANPPPGDPKVETLPKLYKEEGATLELTSPMLDSQLPHWDG